MVTSASVCLVHLFLLAAVKLSCLTDLKTTVQMWDGWKAVKSLEELNFTVFWFWRSSCLGVHWKICFKFLFARSCSFLQSVFVMLASESTTTMCILARSHPALAEGWEHVKSKRFLFWCWHKNREIFTRTNYMMTFECGRGVNDQMCKQNSKRHDRHTFRTLCTPRKNVTKGKTHPQHMGKNEQ